MGRILSFLLLLTKLYSGEVETIISSIQKNFSEIKTASGIMVRKISADKIYSITANFLYKKENKFVINYKNQILYCNGEIFWAYFPEKKNAYKYNVNDMSLLEKESYGITSFFEFDIFSKLGRKYNYELKKINKTKSIIYAFPKGGGKVLSKIEVQIDPQKNLILQFDIYDKKGDLISSNIYGEYKQLTKIYFPTYLKYISYLPNQSIIEEVFFYNVNLNKEISDTEFEFKVPKGVKVINSGHP